ncbi:hypothetical protein [Thermoflavimicrobium dichotomicum]|uniref:Uncharacterized protein n=1 Tax=Thermoflavimicrobium dichotomicum TaxID=46223 RepID=A0A1I3P1X4_9BACL|nr:hypothetical protein [Thermoflavimicrobium dichotomicum]SFJ15362.1 hypothetical protein SAMN05421852_10554 [Thermoflavimicrobium dichotomicum]
MGNTKMVHIQFNQIHVHLISNCSGIFVGSNTQMNWSSREKTNSGSGVICGDEISVLHNIHVVYDHDLYDMLNIKNENNNKGNESPATDEKIPPEKVTLMF